MTAKERKAKVYHADLWGTREQKYSLLDAHDWTDTDWQEACPRSEFYLFVPHDAATLERYQRFIKITDVFPVHSVGIVTARDRLTIRWTPEEMWTTVLKFSRMDPELSRKAYKLGKDVRDWKVTLAQEDLRQSGPDRRHIVPILYRPFDMRYTYYTGRSRGFHCMPRPDVMRHMLVGDNIALVVPRRVEHVGSWQHAFAIKHIAEHVVVSLKTIDYHFPLYLYLDANREGLFKDQEMGDRQPNLNPELLTELTGAFGEQPATEDIFHYSYAILFAPSCREKYAEFLKIDFPRIPFTKDVKLFQKLAALGERLVDLHLLRSSELDPPIAHFQGKGDNKVQTGKKGLRYDAETQRVYINEEQFVEVVSPQVWEYMIGGYQVCHKWLKDRKDRCLTLEEIKTYCRTATALSKTIEIQAEIDKLYPQVEKTLLEIHLSAE